MASATTLKPCPFCKHEVDIAATECDGCNRRFTTKYDGSERQVQQAVTTAYENLRGEKSPAMVAYKARQLAQQANLLSEIAELQHDEQNKKVRPSKRPVHDVILYCIGCGKKERAKSTWMEPVHLVRCKSCIEELME